MIYTIISAMDEGEKIEETIRMVGKTKTDRILIVINGSDDDTYKRVLNYPNGRINMIYINKPLGFDIPRAVGAYFAYREGARGVVFVDGDMSGDIAENIDDIIIDLKYKDVDMALSDCYPEKIREDIAKILFAFIKQLNIELGIFKEIGYSTPSYGPHGLSRLAIKRIGFRNIAIPPVSLALAILNSLSVKVSTRISDNKMGSTVKDEFHAEQVAKMIIGDTIEALCVYRGVKSKRGYDGHSFIGYHKGRRFDLLENFLEI